MKNKKLRYRLCIKFDQSNLDASLVMKILSEDIVNIDLRRNIYFFVYITFPSTLKKVIYLKLNIP